MFEAVATFLKSLIIEMLFRVGPNKALLEKIAPE